jgi:hypothetical protein
MYNRLFRNVWTSEGSASALTTFSLPWPSGQITFTNDSSGVNAELYLQGTAAAANKRMTIGGGESVSFEFGTKEVLMSAPGGAIGYRFWAMG